VFPIAHRGNSGQRSDFSHDVDLDDRYRVPAPSICAWLQERRIDAHWRGIYDDHGRRDGGDFHSIPISRFVEWSNVPGYPQKFSDLGMRLGVNYVYMR